MTYDYHGQWDKQTGHVAPMYQHQLDQNIYFNVVSSLLILSCRLKSDSEIVFI